MPGSGQSAAANSGSGESADAISGQSADAISGELADVISGPAADAISGESADSGFGQSANVTSAGYEKPSLEDIFKNSRIYLPNENEMARNAKTTMFISAAASGWAGWALANPEFGSSVNPITTRGQIMPYTLLLAHPALKTQRHLWVMYC